VNRSLTGVLFVSFLCASLLAQSAPPAKPAPTFRIQGTFTSPWDHLGKEIVIPRDKLEFHGQQPIKTIAVESGTTYVAIPRTEITFRSEQLTKTVVVDGDGSYQADLPVGSYKMTAEGPTITTQGLTPYVQVFRVMQPIRVLINGNLYMRRNNCDMVVADAPEEQINQVMKDECGGEDSFKLSASDGGTLELHIAFPQREIRTDTYYYSSSKSLKGVPVVATYNLFSLEADKVTYDAKQRKLTASGVVVVQDGTGKTRRGDSMTFFLKENGEAVPLP
jgi:hypothetical protein